LWYIIKFCALFFFNVYNVITFSTESIQTYYFIWFFFFSFECLKIYSLFLFLKNFWFLFFLNLKKHSRVGNNINSRLFYYFFLFLSGSRVAYWSYDIFFYNVFLFFSMFWLYFIILYFLFCSWFHPNKGIYISHNKKTYFFFYVYLFLNQSFW